MILSPSSYLFEDILRWHWYLSHAWCLNVLLYINPLILIQFCATLFHQIQLFINASPKHIKKFSGASGYSLFDYRGQECADISFYQCPHTFDVSSIRTRVFRVSIPHLQMMKLPDGQFFSPASMIFNRPLTTNNTQRTLPHIGPARVTYNLKIRLTYWVVPDQERKHWFKLRKSLFTPYFCLEQHCKIPRGWIVATNSNSFLCKK